MPTLQTAVGRMSYFDNGCTDAGVPTLLLLHSSGATHRQWRHLVAQLGQRWRIFAPDLFGYGETPVPDRASSPHRSIVQDELDLLGRLLRQINGPVHLVGHSYGGAVALELALLHPQRIASLAVYEPAMFSLLRDSQQQSAWREISAVAQRQIDLVAANDLRGAASAFIGYWVTPGAFEMMPEALQASVTATMPKVAAEFGEVMRRDGAAPDFSVLTMPLLLLCGSRTTRAARAVTDELRRLLPGPRFVELTGAVHMAPVQQPDLVNPLLLDFLDTTVAGSRQGLRWAG